MRKQSHTENWIASTVNSTGVEKIEAFFAGYAYEPHAHDTFAIGITLSGIQSFNYRGERKCSYPGITMVLHPDEKHDGESGSEHGFLYQMLYIKPALIQSIIRGQPLPFIAGGLNDDARLYTATAKLLQNTGGYSETLAEEDMLYELVTTLYAISDHKTHHLSYDYLAAKRAQEFIHESLYENISLQDLERYADRDRWSLSRDFRLLFGTSPHKYMTIRRLDIAKNHLLLGKTLTESALEAGFFDQSHMAKHFKKTFGLTPAIWQKINQRSQNYS